MSLITSRNNPKIKQVRALQNHKARQASGLFVIEGIHHIGQAVEATQHGGVKLEAIYFSPDLLTSEFAYQLVETQSQLGLACYPTTSSVFQSIATKDNPQGILAVAHGWQSSLSELNPANFPWGVAVIAAQDPGNVGAILRTIDAVGASGLLLLDDSVDPYHPTAVRSSMGSLFWHPVVQSSFSEFAAWILKHSYTVIGTSAHARQDYLSAPRISQPVVLLLGSERTGLSPDHMALCDQLVSLPMFGKISSLNLSVAAGIMLYALLERMSN